MHSSSSKIRKCGHSLKKVAITSATTSSQMDEWYLQYVKVYILKLGFPAG